MNNDPQQDMFGGGGKLKRRRDGVKTAAEHAERELKGWQQQALEHLKKYLAGRKGAPFLAEDFVRWVQFRIQDPPDPRAYGGVMKTAAAAKLIRKVGYAPAGSSNGSPKVQWQAAA